MQVVLASDHAGFALKEYLKPRITDLGHSVIDVGCTASEPPVDYAPLTLAAVEQLVTDQAERAVFTCGNGYAMAMLANRFPGVRAAVCHDAFTARTCVQMGAANVASLGARVVGSELALELVRIWLAAEFTGDDVPRYQWRLAELQAIEQDLFGDVWRAGLRKYVARHYVGAPSAGVPRKGRAGAR